jgi:hypothetical protein
VWERCVSYKVLPRSQSGRRPWPEVAAGAPLSVSESVMTSDDSLSLILRRLDEIERKLDRMMEELRTPTAIGYSVRRGNLPKEG